MYVFKNKRYNNDGTPSKYFNSPRFIRQIPRPSGYYLAVFGRSNRIIKLYLNIINKGKIIIKFDSTRSTLSTIKLSTLNYAYWNSCSKISKGRYLTAINKTQITQKPLNKF